MISPNDLISKIQKKPYETRVRILWGTVLALAVIIFIAWIFGIKSTLNNVNKSDLIKINNPTTTTPQTNTVFARVERVELGRDQLKVYFNFNNSTDDILNISKLEDVSLQINSATIKPAQITDRQNAPFVQKILSHTQNFGILFFPATDAKKANLIFDQMFLESQPANLFQQKLDLNLSELNSKAQLRN